MEEDRIALAREARQEKLAEWLDTLDEGDKLYLFWQLCAWYRGKLIDENPYTGISKTYLRKMSKISCLEDIIQDLTIRIFSGRKET